MAGKRPERRFKDFLDSAGTLFHPLLDLAHTSVAR